MTRTTARLLALAAFLALGACVREPVLPMYYTQPAPPPLQPYLGPPVVAAPAPAVRKRIVRRRTYRRTTRVRCRCAPAQ